MKSYLWVASLALVAFVILVASARADDERGTLVRFKGGIGVHPVSNVTVTAGTSTVTANIVRGVNPAGQTLGDRQSGRQGEDQRGHQGRRKGTCFGWRQRCRTGVGTECVCHADL